MMVATNIEESDRLVEAGVDISTADMEWVMEHWFDYDTGDYEEGWSPVPVCKLDGGDESIDTVITKPAWSLGALLELLRDVVRTFDEDANVALSSYKDHGWHLYSNNAVDSLPILYGFEPIAAAVEMLVQLMRKREELV
ncbi:MAG: hypothetical protein J6Y37_14415 [Paludibacteraceae bacterium]|nr:hypothetical protein [Paludibacteraceae bacterium]